MKSGTASRTAVLVCMGRAVADATGAAGFSDPTALALLPDDARASIERFRSGSAPRGVRERLELAYIERQSPVMIARTVAIDDAVRAAAAPQVVILGAGLDGRAWRMPALRDVLVFEVDHANSQRDKRSRVAALRQTAREVRFVPVDFTRDRLGDALAGAGHDPTLPTTWIWEGVVMYLTAAEVEATLSVIAQRSAAGSRVAVLYQSPALILRVVGLATGWLGEPMRSAFSAEAIRTLLATYGFTVVRDDDMAAIGKTLGPDVVRATEIAKHLRLAIADREPPRRPG